MSAARIRLVALITLLGLICLTVLRQSTGSYISHLTLLQPLLPPQLPSHAQSTGPDSIKPSNLTISGLVFFGRRDRVEVMSCYIKRNLVDNGGWLDNVIWVVNTEDTEDIKFLNTIVAQSSRYKKVVLEKVVWWSEFKHIWRMVERGTLYIKIDDDVVWLADDAIPRLVTAKLKHPEAFAVSANVINNPPLSFLHYHLGALHPFLPELPTPGDQLPPEAETDLVETSNIIPWRPSHHPYWEGPADFVWPLEAEPPSKDHRWLRVEDEAAMNRTPVAKLTYDVWGPTYESWAIAAQQHYSLLENLERNQTDVYRFENLWDMKGERIRINVIAILGSDVLDTDVDHWPNDRGDEDMIVLDLPRKLGRPILIEGRSLAAHFNYMHQGGVVLTDLLARYRAYAMENACFQLSV